MKNILILLALLSLSVFTVVQQQNYKSYIEEQNKLLKQQQALIYQTMDDKQSVIDRKERRVEEVKRLEEHIIKSIVISGARLSDLQMSTMVSVLTRVAMTELDNFEQRELWIAIIANESRFNARAKSPAGAIGLGQVMPRSANWYGEKCGITGVTENDLYDIRINALVSACVYRELLKATGGSAVRAMIGYNAGQFSKDHTRIDQFVNINKETANYIAKITRFLEKTREFSLIGE